MKIFVLVIFSFLAGNLSGQHFVNTGVRNFLLYPSSISQTEPVVCRSPLNPQILFASANTINFNPFFLSEGIYISEDGGQSWYGSDTCKGEYINFHGGDPSIVITKNGKFILTRNGRTPFTGIYVHTSNDFGNNWSFQKQITDHDLERAVLAADNFVPSNYYGRLYSAWVRFVPPYSLYFSYSDDEGLSWSQPQQINNPPQRSAGGDIVIFRNGEIYLTWALVSSTSPFSEQFISFAKSINGGQSWIVSEKIFQVNGIQGTLPAKQNIRVNGLPRIAVDTTGGERDGWIYIVTTQKNFGAAGSDPDIILYRSTDGGNNWSGPIRVNQDQINNGKIQYFPAVAIDKFGGINILYYDDRNTTSDSAGVFLSRSIDGGNTFIDYQISDHNFKPIAIGGLGQGYQGDLITLTSVDNYLIPIWMDNSTGIYQLWTARININELTGVETEKTIPSSFELKQNFPNPFNSRTKIEFVLPENLFVQLDVIDIYGRIVQTVVKDFLTAGIHSVEFEAQNISTGIYFYRLKNSHGEIVRKMLYLK